MEEEKLCECGKTLHWSRASDVNFGKWSTDIEVLYCEDCGIQEVSQG